MNPETTMNSIIPRINKYRRQLAKYDVYELIKLIQEVETNPKLQELLAKEGGPTKGEAALDYVLNKMDRESLEKSPSSRPAITKYLRQAGEKNPSVFADLIQHVETNPEMQASLVKEGEPTKGAAALEHVLNKIDRKFAEKFPSSRPAMTKYLRQAGEKNPSVFADLIQHVETNPEMQASLAKEGVPTKGAAALEHVLNKIDRKFAEELIPSKRSSKKTIPTSKMFPIKSTNDGKTRDAIVTSDQNSRKLYPKFETEGFNRKCDYAKKYATVVNSNLEKNEKAMISKERR
ncbi:hypothetical protein C6P52_09630 [Enterococcus mundtii]|uniref:hypothetical protein n=1 Tax=Enterococcus mundtii TaxID=53346 RepID=UPI000D35EE60|nr:hypothetical protein [Enterococcus mundtii]PTO38327.1 hypothetical protein C6P52_09630 [Enterococcus mundtii]PTO43043.1 hypothetical protein C6P54_10960 [Enterococcus mundtii]